VALSDLGFAVKSLQLYPPTSPVVNDAIERSYRSLAPLLDGGYIRLDVTPAFIRLGDHSVGARTPIVEQLARRLHGSGIARLHIDRHLEPGSLQKLSEIIATEPRAIDERGGIAQMFEEYRPRGILVEFLELDRLFGEAQEDEEEDIWEAILKGYRLAVADDEAVDWEALASSLDRLQEFVGWLAGNIDAIADRTGYENIDVLRFVIDRLGSISSALTSDHVDLLVLAVRQAFNQFDPNLLVELLADPLELEVDGDSGSEGAAPGVSEFPSGLRSSSGERKTIDVGSYIARGLDPDQAESLILHTLRTQQLSTPRLYGLFDRLTRDRPEREEMAHNIQSVLAEEVARGERQSEFLSNWPRLLEVLNGESPRRFLSAEYEVGLQYLLAPADLDKAWPIDRIRPRLSEMSKSFIALRKSLMVARLLDHDIDSASYRRLALELERSLQALLLENQFRTLQKLLKDLLSASKDEDRPAERRDIAAGVVERFYTRETIRALVAASLGHSRQNAVHITEIIRARGTEVIPLLLDALADEQTQSVRQRLLRILPQMGDEVGELVVKRFDDDRWFVLRNLAMILGEVGSADMVEHLAPMVGHADPRVRREAIVAAIRLGGERVGPLLTDALDDDDPTALLTAAHGLGYHPHAPGTARLREFLESPNPRGQNTTLIQVAAVALGRLADTRSRAKLEQLARRPWLFAARRRPARDAAEWALVALDGKPGGKVPLPPVFAEVRPAPGPRRNGREG
jgi:HEAT repeat protein